MSDEQANKPDFDTIRRVNEQGIEYWSARDLSKLLGYTKWQKFENVINRAITACKQIGQNVEDHITQAGNMIEVGKGAKRLAKDYLLSRFGSYLIAQNGDPHKVEIAAAQAYFATAARENELYQLAEDQSKRIVLRQRLDAGNEHLEQAAYDAGVLPRSFGLFHKAGYEGLYGGIGPDEIKKLKGIDPKENLLDRMGLTELATNSFRAAQTAEMLKRDGIIGQTAAMDAHKEVGKTVREAIKKIGNTLPENLPAEPSIKPLLRGRRRKVEELPGETEAEETDAE